MILHSKSRIIMKHLYLFAQTGPPFDFLWVHKWSKYIYWEISRRWQKCQVA